MVFLTGIYVGGVFGGSIRRYLINIPGTPALMPATWDGYPMTKKGLAARALGISIICSAIGGTLSAVIMTFGSQPFASFALRFGSAEFFAATVLGLVSVIAIARGRMLVSLISLFVGIAVGSVGLDPMYGQPRLTFGSQLLESGIDFVVVLVGMFAFSEVLWWVAQGSKKTEKVTGGRTKLPALRDLYKLRATIARGTLVGCIIGAIPGAGAAVGAVIAYGVERQSFAPPRRVRYRGRGGACRAGKAAQNATTGTATIPLLTLGIPGSAATAIMLAALTVHGIQPGPALFLKSADLVYTVFAGYLVGNVLMIFVGLIVARGFASLMKIPEPVLFGFITVLCLIGAFGVRNNISDVYICLGFGIVGTPFAARTSRRHRSSLASFSARWPSGIS